MSLSEPAPKPPKRRRFRHWALRFAWAWLIYTLSIGPMFWMWFEAMYVDGPKWIFAFYLPLLIACELCPPFGWLVNEYINLWIV
uniref:Uncharacterized protein n=1 Tax=Schlesneria paludicola TaxID=360056 RepID=A0A7C2JYW3_9PLAN